MAEIRIHFDGDVAGVEAHRLSISAFGKPLEQFLSALRRTAGQLVSQAVDSEAPDVGRFNNIARQLDIEIEGIGEGSIAIKAVLPYRHAEGELPLFADLPKRAAELLFDGIERESRGETVSGAARRYLRTLPQGLTKQVYEVYEGGKMTKQVQIGSIALSAEPEDLPFLREYAGSIVGIGFEPGKSEVRVKMASAVASIEAVPSDIERALTLRNQPVRVLAVQNTKSSRLLILGSDLRREKPDMRQAASAIFNRWEAVFAELAK